MESGIFGRSSLLDPIAFDYHKRLKDQFKQVDSVKQMPNSKQTSIATVENLVILIS